MKNSILLFMGLCLGQWAQSQQVVGVPLKKPEPKISLDTIALDNKDYLLGKIQYEKYKSSFVMMYAPYANTSNMYLRKDAWDAFCRMADAAKVDGIHLTVISGARNFERQSKIWEAKWNGERKVEGLNLATQVKDPIERAKYILLYSSMPGTSRHHWGTDIDINNLEDKYFLSGEGKKEYAWLVANAHKYGFCQPYTRKGKDREFGYEEEKWHWTYMPVSSVLMKQYQKQVTLDDIKGFLGSETAKELDVIKKYVLGISSDCK